MRDMHAVVKAMCEELEKSGAPIDVVAPLNRLLRHVAQKQGLTAPEAMPELWTELSFAFNRVVFGSSDQARWVRADAPAWAVKAGAILAGEVRVEGQ